MMNYLEKKKKAMLNYVSGSQPSVNIDIVTHSTGGNASLDVTYNGTTTNYSASAINNEPIDLGILLLMYRPTDWQIISKGNIDINGETLAPMQVKNWSYQTSVDYTVSGTEATVPNNVVRIYTISRSGSASINRVLIADSEEYTMQYANDTAYNKDIQVVYTNKWNVTANRNVEYNGVTYTNGQTVDSWAYNVYKDIQIDIL